MIKQKYGRNPILTEAEYIRILNRRVVRFAILENLQPTIETLAYQYVNICAFTCRNESELRSED
jgi:hypothetical protein